LGSSFTAAGGYTSFESLPLPPFPPTTISGGVLDFESNSFTLPQLTHSAGTLTGSGNISITQLAWTGGWQSGTGITTLSGTSTWSSSAAQTVIDRMIVNNGTATWTSGDIYANNGNTINNLQSFTALAAGSTFYTSGSATSRFINLGTLTCAPASGTIVWALPLDTRKVLQISTGVLQISSQSTLAGDVQVSSTLQFASGSSNSIMTTTSTVRGSGVINYLSGSAIFVYGSYAVSTVVAGGSAYWMVDSLVRTVPAITLNSGLLRVNAYDATATSLTLNGGTLEVNGILYTTSANWAGEGYVQGSGNWTVNTLLLDTPIDRYLYINVLQLNGYSRWNKGNWYDTLSVV
jgi:hypothetical protein